MTSPIACKICYGAAYLAGHVDSNKCCIDRMGERLLPVGYDVAYHICSACGLIFTRDFDDWMWNDWRDRIYNDDYARVNPPIPGRENVPLHETPSYRKGMMIADWLAGRTSRPRILDYGAGGNPGGTGQALIDRGFDVTSYDPYCPESGDDDDVLREKFGLVVCIEVLEHIVDFDEFRQHMNIALSRDGQIWLETLIHPHPAPANILSSWYVAPRDGHVSVHTMPSLRELFRPIGMEIEFGHGFGRVMVSRV